MKYSQTIGVVLCLLLIGTCFLPWSYFSSLQLTVTGMNAESLGYGKPALVNIFFSIVGIIFFLIPKVGVKRVNLFISSINIAWAIRNYVLLNTCSGGDCPQNKIGIYLLVVLAAGILLMSMLPTHRVKFGED